MSWTINVSEGAAKQFKKLDKQITKRITDYLANKISNSINPRQHGKALSHDKIGLWRYRVGDYRIICKIEDESVTILILEVGHRKNIYE